MPLDDAVIGFAIQFSGSLDIGFRADLVAAQGSVCYRTSTRSGCKTGCDAL
ncbi:MAG TPA: hypothetical protein VIZ17_22270 [Acetobacteraceae bacterium]